MRLLPVEQKYRWRIFLVFLAVVFTVAFGFFFPNVILTGRRYLVGLQNKLSGQNFLEKETFSKRISFESDCEKIKDFKINENSFSSLLEQTNFWFALKSFGEKYNDGRVLKGMILRVEPLDKKDGEIFYEFKNENGEVYQAAGVKAENEKLILSFYLASRILESEQKEDLSKRISINFIRIFYGLTRYNSRLGDKDLGELIDQYLKEDRLVIGTPA